MNALAGERGGLIPTHRLRVAGCTARQIAALCHKNLIVRVRQGWYALPETAANASQAARVGGQLTCADALSAHDVWVVRDHRLHVAVRRNACQLRSRSNMHARLDDRLDDVVVHWRRVGHPPRLLIADVADALHDYRRCAGDELYRASLDSAINRRPALVPELRRAGHPVDRNGIDGIAESGIETLFFQRMRPRRVAMRRQVSIPTVGRVDILIGERLVIELDGEGYHDTASQFERDRERDARLSALGYRVLRFSYRQVMHDWPAVERAVLAAVFRGDHLA